VVPVVIAMVMSGGDLHGMVGLTVPYVLWDVSLELWNDDVLQMVHGRGLLPELLGHRRDGVLCRVTVADKEPTNCASRRDGNPVPAVHR